jgi:predicted kinase
MRLARDLAAQHGVPFRFVECRTTPEVCRQRLERREAGSEVSDARLPMFNEFRANFEAPDERAPAEHLVVDTTQPLEGSLASLRTKLDTWPKGLVA